MMSESCVPLSFFLAEERESGGVLCAVQASRWMTCLIGSTEEKQI